MTKNKMDGGSIQGPLTLDAAALTPAATVALSAALASIFTLTPAENETINATGLTEGETLFLLVTTSGSSSFTLTFGTNFVTTGTLATGTTTAKKFLVQFLVVGGKAVEVSRTAAM